MVVLVIGLGSMGRRRIRLIRNNFPQHIILGVDLQQERRRLCEETFNIQTYSSISEAIKETTPEVAFVCASPISHSKIITECLKNGLNVFTEINLVNDSYNENIEIAKKSGKVLFLSSTFLYRKEINYIIERTKNYTGNLLYSYHVGQYLPDWHPWENYKDFFLSDKRTNGCREILAIELPWIIRNFGKVADIKVQRNKISKLDIDYPDSYVITLLHENGHLGVLIVDLIAREALKELSIIGENIYIKWSGKPDSLQIYDTERKTWEKVELYSNIDKTDDYNANIIENAYLEEICSFFNEIKYRTGSVYSFQDDIYTLDLIDRIEEYNT